MKRADAFHATVREALCAVVRLLVGAYPVGAAPSGHTPSIYFANHTSHLDTMVILAAMRLRARAVARPVAARDYWTSSAFKRWLAQRVLNVVFIDRLRELEGDPLEPVRAALREGASIIIFPEGTRHESDLPGEFKSGLFLLAQDFPDLRLKPVYLENLHRILPKGSWLPLPLINRVHFGHGLERIDGETKPEFLVRARDAVIDLAPSRDA